ncbi:hypothetical protein J6590_059376 [Homalodisca vitripennis]|nr:hypothetical protein J6590_059376 [Homalodisca vitripennis]
MEERKGRNIMCYSAAIHVQPLSATELDTRHSAFIMREGVIPGRETGVAVYSGKCVQEQPSCRPDTYSPVRCGRGAVQRLMRQRLYHCPPVCVRSYVCEVSNYIDRCFCTFLLARSARHAAPGLPSPRPDCVMASLWPRAL